MGTEMGHIEQEFILSDIIEKTLPVKLHLRKIEIEGIFLSIEDDNSLIFSSSDTEVTNMAVGEYINFFFAFFSHTMTFSSKIIKDGNPLKVSLPKHIYKNLKRKFVRVRPGQEIELSFTLENAKIVLDFPKTQEYESLQEDIYTDEFDMSSLKELFQQFKAKAASYSDESEIIMLRGKNLNTFEEKIITDTGKSLVIPDTRLPLPKKSKINSEYAITEELFLDERGNEIVVCNKNLRQLEVLIKKKREEEIFSELFTPVIYHEYAISYIHLYNNKTRNKPFTDKTLTFVREFSRILAFSLEKQGYFSEGILKESNFNPEIIDLSASGLLFTHPEKKLSEMLGMYGDLKLMLKIGPRKIEMLSRVMRKYKVKGIYFYGIQFLEIVPEDFRFLFDYVYGRPFSDEDDKYWEGGAEPPELNF